MSSPSIDTNRQNVIQEFVKCLDKREEEIIDMIEQNNGRTFEELNLNQIRNVIKHFKSLGLTNIRLTERKVELIKNMYEILNGTSMNDRVSKKSRKNNFNTVVNSLSMSNPFLLMSTRKKSVFEELMLYGINKEDAIKQLIKCTEEEADIDLIMFRVMSEMEAKTEQINQDEAVLIEQENAAYDSALLESEKEREVIETRKRNRKQCLENDFDCSVEHATEFSRSIVLDRWKGSCVYFNSFNHYNKSETAERLLPIIEKLRKFPLEKSDNKSYDQLRKVLNIHMEDTFPLIILVKILDDYDRILKCQHGHHQQTQPNIWEIESIYTCAFVRLQKPSNFFIIVSPYDPLVENIVRRLRSVMVQFLTFEMEAIKYYGEVTYPLLFSLSKRMEMCFNHPDYLSCLYNQYFKPISSESITSSSPKMMIQSQKIEKSETVVTPPCDIYITIQRKQNSNYSVVRMNLHQFVNVLEKMLKVLQFQMYRILSPGQFVPSMFTLIAENAIIMPHLDQVGSMTSKIVMSTSNHLDKDGFELVSKPMKMNDNVITNSKDVLNNVEKEKNPHNMKITPEVDDIEIFRNIQFDNWWDYFDKVEETLKVDDNDDDLCDSSDED